ncbi:hypothetical protein QAD02_013046 [Eretmocerus hayati]|uniref:Uncharacterized protein n=1 Tax=Eretmocerus hayati TaxID=131215 RepID=A0ACC2P129_9HYME|nr:hypothetical protein QAD02_013046 [Eretmocerus hayati]
MSVHGSSDDESNYEVEYLLSDNEDHQILIDPNGYDSDDNDVSDGEEGGEESNPDKTQGKPKKGKNFSWAEKLLLCELVGQAKDTIENVSSNNNITLAKKNEAWASITFLFEALSTENGIKQTRTEAQLRRLWERIKTACRKEDSDYQQRKLLSKTGNLSIIKDKKTTNKEILYQGVRKIVPTVDFILNNKFDSTGQIEGLQECDTEPSCDLTANAVPFEQAGASGVPRLPIERAHTKKKPMKILHSNKENTATLERSPLKNVSNLKRASASQVTPDILGQRLYKTADFQVSRGKKKKSATDIRIEFEGRTKKQDECTSTKAEIFQMQLDATSQQLKYWTTMARMSEMDVQIREKELQAKAYAVSVQRMKYQYWKSKKLCEFESENPQAYNE